MNIGLIDGDFIPKKSNIFNLDLMQLSAYYKKNRNIVNLLTDENKIPFFSKVYYLKDYPTDKFPKFIQEPNVEYAGRAFSEDIYIPFKDEIRFILPDKTIYRPPDKKPINSYDMYAYNNHATHLRLGDLPLKLKSYYEIPIETNLVLHDYNIVAVPNYQELLQSIYTPRHSILAKYPILINSFSDLTFLTQLKLNSDTLMVYTLPITLEELEQVCSLGSRSFFESLRFRVMKREVTAEECPAIFKDILTRILLLKPSKKAFQYFTNIVPQDWFYPFIILNRYGGEPTTESFLNFYFNQMSLSSYLKLEAMLKKYDLFELASRRPK